MDYWRNGRMLFQIMLIGTAKGEARQNALSYIPSQAQREDIAP